MAKSKDLTGMKFNRWTVIERAGSDKHGKAIWLCKCECGNEKNVNGCNLTSGKTKSCGCLQKEHLKKLNEEQWKNENYRQKIIETTKQKWKDEDYKQKMSEKMKKQNTEQWENKDFRQKIVDLGKQRTGNKSSNWKGGISPISKHLRGLFSQWSENCKQQVNYICQLTGKHGCYLHTHHLKSLNTIIEEAHILYNIQIKETIKDYTDEELKILEKYVAEWHKDNSNAVVLCTEVHDLFHKLYGKGNNTPEQYIEFKERYLAGEFNKK